MNPLNWLFPKRPGDFDLSALTGEWHGCYQQHQHQRRIVASLVQDGDRISGQMRDLDANTSESLSDAVANAGLAPGADEQIDEQIRKILPEAGREPIITRSVLPTESVLDGTVNGDVVRFTKAYQGQSFHGYEIGERGIGYATPGHSVEYTGRLSRDRKRIIGQWMIYQKDSSHGFLNGTFELIRGAPDAAWPSTPTKPGNPGDERA
jgi:hypothetical protein